MARPLARPKNRFVAAFLVTLLGAFTLLCASLAQGPDRDLSYSVEVRSKVAAKTLVRALELTPNWPRWLHSTRDAKLVDGFGNPYSTAQQTAERGALAKLWIKTPKEEFELLVEVTQLTSHCAPECRMDLSILRDTSGHLSRLFGRVAWSITLIPQPDGGTLIRGEARARTANWKSRVFGTMLERFVMRQVYYPNLTALASIEHPQELLLLQSQQ